LWKWLRDNHTVVALVVTTLALLLALVQAVLAQHNTAEQLELSRKQFAVESTPAVVPIPFEEGRPLYLDNYAVQFEVKNASQVPAFGGTVKIAPLEETPTERDAVAVYPTCGEFYPVAGHKDTRPLAPVAPGETITVTIRNLSFTPGSSLCVALGYTDANGTISITDWVWTPSRELPPEPFSVPITTWIPTDVRPFVGEDADWARDLAPPESVETSTSPSG
jgi:hypothetical protein